VDGNVRRDVVMVKKPGLFSPHFGARSSHVFTQSPQDFTIEIGIHSLACRGTGASHYLNCCTDGSISPEYFG
jgi:hypothetical protein